MSTEKKKNRSAFHNISEREKTHGIPRKYLTPDIAYGVGSSKDLREGGKKSSPPTQRKKEKRLIRASEGTSPKSKKTKGALFFVGPHCELGKRSTACQHADRGNKTPHKYIGKKWVCKAKLDKLTGKETGIRSRKSRGGEEAWETVLGKKCVQQTAVAGHGGRRKKLAGQPSVSEEGNRGLTRTDALTGDRNVIKSFLFREVGGIRRKKTSPSPKKKKGREQKKIAPGQIQYRQCKTGMSNKSPNGRKKSLRVKKEGGQAGASTRSRWKS